MYSRVSAGVSALRQMLPHAWYSFLGRFAAPTSVQQRGIPQIVRGASVLLVAPTATGKTEAYAAPIAERIAVDGGGELSAWIVCPTRALVNDLARRLAAPLGAMGLRLGRRTGEHKEIANNDRPHLVITTPESLDSLLARSPQSLVVMRDLVLDEVHLLDGTPRGDQLACLVSRLRRVAPKLRIIASSATVDRPEDLAGRYLASNFALIKVSGGRSLDPTYVWGGAGELAAALFRMTHGSTGARKVLTFVPRRADAEELFGQFQGRAPFGDAVFLHHGKLARARREAVERRMLSGTAGLCFATTTLEVGIDIGDVDLVALTSPPPDVSSLVQRTGRGNRRDRIIRVLCMCRDRADEQRYRHLVSAAEAGRLLEPVYHFSTSVLVQQCLGLVMQTPKRWITAEALAARLPGWLEQQSRSSEVEELLDYLADSSWLKKAGQRFYPGEKLESAYVRGVIHTNIENRSNNIKVVDQQTRKVIGTIRKCNARGEIVLGGRHLKITHLERNNKAIAVNSRKLAEPETPLFGRRPLSYELAWDFARFLGLPPGEAPVLRIGRVVGKRGTILFHFLGGIWSRLLTQLLEKQRRLVVLQENSLCAVIAGECKNLRLEFSLEEIETVARSTTASFKSCLSLGPWFHHLPREWQRDHIVSRLDTSKFFEVQKKLDLATAPLSPEMRELLLQISAKRC